MGFWDHLFDSDWRQREDISALQKQARHRSKTLWKRSSQKVEQDRRQDERIVELQDAVGALALLCKGTMHMLKEKGVWDEAAFQRICEEIDSADGQRDGKTPVRHG